MSEFHSIQIGEYSYGPCFEPSLDPGISIGRYTSIAEGVRIFRSNHPLDRLSTHPFLYEARHNQLAVQIAPPPPLEIGHDVWIGCNALIMPGCRRIGTGSVIGAGAVVTKDVSDFTIVAGNPARPIRERFQPDTIERLQQSQWWLLPLDELLSRSAEFDNMLTAGSAVASGD